MIRLANLADLPPGLPGARYHPGLEPDDEMFGLGYLGQDYGEKMKELGDVAIPAAFVALTGWFMHRYLPKKAETFRGAGQVMVGVSMATFALDVYKIYLQKKA